MGHAGRGYDRVSAEFDITRQGVVGVKPAALGRPATTFCMHNSGDQRQMAPSYSHISKTLQDSSHVPIVQPASTNVLLPRKPRFIYIIPL
jgi:hypothetical protein